MSNALLIPLAPALAAMAPGVASATLPNTAPGESKEGATLHAEAAAPTPAQTSSPESSTSFIQYGVAFTVEGVASAGPLCVDPCILDSGGGVAVRVGHRAAGPFYFGAAYELSKQGSNNIYRLGILQQLRGEIRYYVDTRRVTQPFFQGALGVAGYGNEWAIETKGPLAGLGVGAQVQISRNTVVGAAIGYRALLLSSLTDSAGAYRPGGIASMIGFDLQLEALDLWPFASDATAPGDRRSTHAPAQTP